MNRDGAFAVEVVSMAEPIAPKIDLVLGNDGLEWADEPIPSSSVDSEREPLYNELVQSISLGLLMQRGDFRYNRRRGMPWVQHDKMKPHTAIMGSNFNADNLRRIEMITMMELNRADDRVARVLDVKAKVSSPEDFAQRRLHIEAKVQVRNGELVNIAQEVKV